jgi:5'-3' exonuclease
VEPTQIPDLLALVGDTADGYPGIPGIGKVTAARLVTKHGCIEEFPDEVLGDKRELALLFKDLATLRATAEVIRGVDDMRWPGPTPAFAACIERLGDRRLIERAAAASPR